jgi:hypothetical protein
LEDFQSKQQDSHRIEVAHGIPAIEQSVDSHHTVGRSTIPAPLMKEPKEPPAVRPRTEKKQPVPPPIEKNDPAAPPIEMKEEVVSSLKPAGPDLRQAISTASVPLTKTREELVNSLSPVAPDIARQETISTAPVPPTEATKKTETSVTPVEVDFALRQTVSTPSVQPAETTEDTLNSVAPVAGDIPRQEAISAAPVSPTKTTEDTVNSVTPIAPDFALQHTIPTASVPRAETAEDTVNSAAPAESGFVQKEAIATASIAPAKTSEDILTFVAPSEADLVLRQTVTTDSVPPFAEVVNSEEIEDFGQETAVQAQTPTVEIKPGTTDLVVDPKAEKPTPLPPRRARIEEISPERRDATRAVPGKPGDSKRSHETRQQASAEKHDRSATSRAPSEAAPTPADELFQNREGADRSPAAWAEKLRQAFSPRAEQKTPSDQPVRSITPPGDNESPRSNQAIPKSGARMDPKTTSSLSSHTPSESLKDAPVKISDSTRRFLKPLVGIDPATAPVYEGPLAAQITFANQADGVAVAGNIALNPSQVRETPEKLGLLAHELTHVARQRKPRFVPPVARQRPNALIATPSPEHLDEEALARRVEARVIDAANRGADRPTEEPALNSPQVERAQIPEPETEEAGPSESVQSTWGGLPAPWEPLPDWVLALPAAAPMRESSSMASEVLSSPPAVAASSLAAHTAAVTNVGSVERAEAGRVLEHSAPPSPASAAEGQKASPDLDALARQVYSVLKRRLEAEQRRQLF